ncbi:hypothetical protein K6Y31_19480 [Motilimonas cestriensis]|uniref:Uncharacterized protein n=1 Tax=Motilimonas cestriensis TaxID=2742685 RepID=A0ABS8WGR6_9GAMM|nr:hypothetical protein [Motilimonas cestriensis]MCE2596961.1 hypothetical protein [Motilimonas cestriensis]
MLQQMMRLNLYSGLGFFAFAMIVLNNPIGNTATWLTSLILIGIGFWIELGDDFQEDEDDQDN